MNRPVPPSGYRIYGDRPVPAYDKDNKSLGICWLVYQDHPDGFRDYKLIKVLEN